jgi:hypothetical protein
VKYFTTRQTITTLTVIATASLLTACGGLEQSVDIEKLKTAPVLSAPFGAGQTGRTTTTDGNFYIAYTYTTAAGTGIAMQWQANIEGTSSARWGEEAAEKIATKQIAGATVTDVVPLSPAPQWAMAWTGSIEEYPAFAQVWERGKCSAIVMASLPAAELVAPLNAIDAQLREACGD